ncbi:hypothetical protein Tco_1501898 [Tanacetum coccineum]
MDIHFVRDQVAAGHVRVLHVPSRYNFADIFTKGLHLYSIVVVPSFFPHLTDLRLFHLSAIMSKISPPSADEASEREEENALLDPDLLVALPVPLSHNHPLPLVYISN